MPQPSAKTEIFHYDLYNEYNDPQPQGPKVQISRDAYVACLDLSLYLGDANVGTSVACLPTGSLTTQEIDVIMALTEEPASTVTPMVAAVRRRLAQD